MSVNITVNGKFAKHCRTHPLLDDPQKVKKAEEQERRKLRILQVREESKRLAKKIRDEVNAEKKRELEKLQAIKQQELECWRQHALDRKGEEYRSAIFQVGTAHNAARLENAKKDEKQRQQGTYKSFKKQVAARKLNQGRVQFDKETSCPIHQTSQSVRKQFTCTCVQTDNSHENKPEEHHKRKRHTSFSSSDTECEDEGYKEQTTLPQSSFSLSSTYDDTTTSTLSEQNRATQTSMFVPANSNCLIKTPAVCLDVEVGSEDSITISAPIEVKDKHTVYNRQFSSVIRVSPHKSRKSQKNTNENPSVQKSRTTTATTTATTTQSSDVTTMPSEEVLQRSPTKQSTAFQQVTAKEKRFTLISDLVKKQQQQQVTNITSTHENKYVTPMYPTVSHTTASTATPHVSPRKQVKQTTVRPAATRPLSPRKTSAISKSSNKTITDTSQPTTTVTLNSKINTAVQTAAASSTSSGRVQFFDYNSKTCKEREQSAANVSVQRQKDNSLPTAMEQAALENQREKERQLEALKQSQIMEERSKKALEREQIRRDCHELSEKLDALTKEYPNQGPTNENQLHLFADKKLRKEAKINSAIESLLNRPAIITCSEINAPADRTALTIKTAKTNNVATNEINLGAVNQHLLPADDVSSDSCCSILLGYVDDQSKLVKQDLQDTNNVGNNQDVTKQERLRSLLKRLDELRNSLLQELKTENESKIKKQSKLSSNEKAIKQVLDSIGEMHKERHQIISKDNAKPDIEVEKPIEDKNSMLEQKVKEFYELKKKEYQQATVKDLKSKKNKENIVETSLTSSKTEEQQASSNDRENVICTTAEKPIEIIITVRGDNKIVKIPQKPKRKIISRKSPSIVATLIKSPQPKARMNKRQTPKKKLQPSTTTLQEKEALKRQSSYDSNSTSYASLPSQLHLGIEELAEKRKLEKQTTKTTTTQERTEETFDGVRVLKQPPARINPLIAQYVQRLLQMRSNAVHKLGVSSSDIETPSSSIINTSTNISNSDILITDEHLLKIHSFMEENRSFVKDLEKSMRSQNNVSLESSMKMFDDIWQQRFKKSHKITYSNNKPATEKSKDENQTKKSSLKSGNNIKTSTTTTSDKKPAEHKQNQSKSITKTITKTNSEQITAKSSSELGKSLSSYTSSDDKESLRSVQGNKPAVKKIDKAIDTRLSNDSQAARTLRIAVLSQLIDQVRGEKQRIVDKTLSSVSENGRNSTEYHDLSEGKSSSTSTEETTQNKQPSYSTDTAHEVAKLSTADKNKQITASRDSGIAESRPITALEQRIDVEPVSQTSTEWSMPKDNKKVKPPPTLKRYSPKMPEDELPHELSTILEVDTPATSRITTAISQTTVEREIPCENAPLREPIKFPTFEEYIKQLNLDITQLDSEESIKLQQEFMSFLECLQKTSTPNDILKYINFPSLNNYLKNLTDSDQASDILQETLTQLHLNTVSPRNFPSVREYIQRNGSKATNDEQQLLDTESLENLTEEGTETETASIDIEEEMKRRKILKNSFRYIERKKTEIFSSTANKDAEFYKDILATESGVEKLSSSDNTTEKLDMEIKRITQQITEEKEKQFQYISSTTNSANTSTLANSALQAASKEESSNDNSGKALNLRDYLTRELLKRASISGSTTSSSGDDSLHNHFIKSLLGSLTPRTPGVNSKSGSQTIERHKTSTPVLLQSAHSTGNNSSPNHPFSVESGISSVHLLDRSNHFSNSDGGNTDHHSSK